MATKKPAPKPSPKRPARKKAVEAPAPETPPPGWAPAPPPYPPPAGAAPSIDQNQWAMFAHLAAFASFVVPFGNIVGPLVVWQVKKENPFVAEHGKESLNFQISMTLYGLMIVVLLMVLMVAGFLGTAATLRPEPVIGALAAFLPLFLLMVAWAVFNIVMIILGSLRASNGVSFRYPLSIRFVR